MAQQYQRRGMGWHGLGMSRQQRLDDVAYMIALLKVAAATKKEEKTG